MLTEYLEAAMKHAHCEILKDDSTYYGEIPECQGVYANAPTLEGCQSKLREALEDWILFRVYRHLELPKIEGIELTAKKAVDRENAPTPPVLYKYYAFNKWTQNVFEQNEIYFQSPDGFNDPFDSKPSTTYEGTELQRADRLVKFWQKSFPGEKEEDLRSQAFDRIKDCQDIPLMLRTLKRSAERIRKRLGIFCMTSKRDNILMWSHYAAAHTGFCLGFKTGNPFFGQVHPVGYSSDRFCLNLIESPPDDDMFRAMRAKAGDWEYEDEWRVIDHIEGPGVHRYPPETLSGVILGCRITPDNRHRIMQWCRARNPRPDIYWAEEKDRDFGLDIRRIPWDPQI
jgi:predicted RNase H-like HicB family nuclease